MSADGVPKPPALWSLRMLGVHVLAATVVAAMVATGWWQLGRYDDQREQALRSAAAAAAAADPVALTRVLPADAAFPADQVGTKVTATGHYDRASRQFYVRGRPLRGRAGFWVLSPLRIGSSAILVVRGWVERPPSAPPPPLGKVTVTGWLEPPEPVPAGIRPGSAGRVLRSVSTAALVARLPYDLFSGYVVLASQRPASSGLAPVPQPVQQVSAAAGWRNLAYASQWWVFAGFVLFMWWRIVRNARVA